MLRAKLKQWERDFSNRHGRKPNSKDIKGDAKVHAMYKQYHREKAAALRGDASPVEEQTPEKPQIKEVFPTPQHQGRVLGLFDIQLAATEPSTPQKTLPATPVKKILDTPIAQRTPSYMSQTGGLFADGESPLIPRRASKSISQLIEEVENMSDIDSEFEPASPTKQPESIFALQKETEQETPTTTGLRPWRKKGQKRTTRRVVMRPVTENDVVSKRAATDNYKRLNIQKKKPFGRRGR